MASTFHPLLSDLLQYPHSCMVPRHSGFLLNLLQGTWCTESLITAKRATGDYAKVLVGSQVNIV